MGALKSFWLHNRIYVVLASLTIVWLLLHIPAITYGTQDVALHMSYVGDEQSPVNGALHILQDKSLFALKDLKTVYYGPVFSALSIPAVVVDFGEKIVTHGIRSAAEYRDLLLSDWGGIIWKLRVLSVLLGLMGLLGLYKLLYTHSVNPSQRFLPVLLGVSLLAFNFYYFEYVSFWKHWAIVIPVLIWQIYFLVRFIESEFKIKYLTYSAFLFFISFGVSYLGLIFQVMWLPLVYDRYKQKDHTTVKKIVYYIVALLGIVAVVVLWHPRAFWRITGLVGSDIVNGDQSVFSTEKSVAGLSFAYYALLIIKNHLALIIFSIIAYVHLSYQDGLRKVIWFWPIMLVGLTSFLVFGLVSHHESRYCLPVITSFVVLIACMLPAYFDSKRSKLFDIAMGTLFIFGLLYQLVYIGLWTNVIAQGPEEQQAISTIVNFETEHPGSRTLAVQYYLFGRVHTKDAYQAYALRTNKSDYNLYKAILDASTPQNIFPINVYYLRPDSIDAYSPDVFLYDQVVYRIDPRVEINQFDYFDEDLSRLWWHRELSTEYFFAK